MNDLERLDEAAACHDDDPPRGADPLRAVDPSALPPRRWPGYANLLNHVLGEKLRRWDEALQRQRVLLAAAGAEPPAVLWRQAATAARLARDEAAGAEYGAAFARASGGDPARCDDLLRLCDAMYEIPAADAETAGAQALAALAPFDAPAWQAAGPLDAGVAAAANNLASDLVERSSTDLRRPGLRRALSQAAELAHRHWLRAGEWMHHERALYLRAMAANQLGEASEARDHARAALAILDVPEQVEDVDRAFIELEHAHACERLGQADEAAARHAAQALADRFDDAGLTAWFERRRAALAALA